MQPAAGATRQPREYVPDRAESDVDDPDLGAAAMEADAEGGGGGAEGDSAPPAEDQPVGRRLLRRPRRREEASRRAECARRQIEEA